MIRRDQDQGLGQGQGQMGDQEIGQDLSLLWQIVEETEIGPLINSGSDKLICRDNNFYIDAYNMYLLVLENDSQNNWSNAFIIVT